MPTVPLVICISPLNMKLQIRDSYQPNAKGDHSNECTRTGEGSTPTSLTWLIFCKVAGEARSEIKSCRGTRADTCCVVVKIVCSGNSGSQLSIHCDVGSNCPVWDWPDTEYPLRLLMLFCLEKLCTPAGILPRAFSDMPRSCVGTASSTTEEAREGFSLGSDCDGVGRSSSLSSSSSPIVNVPSSSGTLLNAGARECVVAGLLKLSTELLVDSTSKEDRVSFLLRLRLSISSCPLSRVKFRNASKRFLFLKIAATKTAFAKKGQHFLALRRSFPLHTLRLT